MRNGDWITTLVGGRKVPGVIITEPRSETSEYASKDPARFGQIVHRPVQRASVLSFRETNPNGSNPGQTYLAVTDENLTGFSFPRLLPQIGLDVTEYGEVIPVAKALDLAMDSMLAYQQARLAAAQDVEVSLD